MITVPNFRDVAASFVRDATRIAPGRLYRSATPWLASAEDISYMTDELGIKLILDLRTATEQRQGHRSVKDCSFALAKGLSPLVRPPLLGPV